MFGIGYSGTASTVDPDEERAPPPPPTLVYFPQNDLEFPTDNEWSQHPPNLFKRYCRISKPADVKIEHLQALNLSVENDVDLERLIPRATDGINHLPSKISGQATPRKSLDLKPTAVLGAPNNKHPILSNGTKSPEHDIYVKFCKELGCDNEDALRFVGRRKPRPGHPPPNISHFRKFWTHLELMFSYWDSTLDNYYDVSESQDKAQQKPSKGFKRFSVSVSQKEPLPDTRRPSSGKRYKGRRTSTGSRMPEHFRIDVVRQFIEPLCWAFGCIMAQPKRVPQLEIKNLLVPVTQTSVVWRTPQDKSQSKRGMLEGPVLSIQCRAEIGFSRDKHAAPLDAAREAAGLLLLSQERAREGKSKVVPGEGKWYTTTPRWGGGPGGEFGEAEGDTDIKPLHGAGARRNSMPMPASMALARRGMTEEQIWKELRPGPGLWDPRATYLAIGKDRFEQFDNVFMVSSLFHHVAILKLRIHPLYVDFLITGKPPASPPPDTQWQVPELQRSRWYDFLKPEDRIEAMRALWGVMSYQMRSGESVNPLTSHQRQKSEVHHHFSFRKKSHAEAKEGSSRSSSVAF